MSSALPEIAAHRRADRDHVRRLFPVVGLDLPAGLGRPPVRGQRVLVGDVLDRRLPLDPLLVDQQVPARRPDRRRLQPFAPARARARRPSRCAVPAHRTAPAPDRRRECRAAARSPCARRDRAGSGSSRDPAARRPASCRCCPGPARPTRSGWRTRRRCWARAPRSRRAARGRARNRGRRRRGPRAGSRGTMSRLTSLRRRNERSNASMSRRRKRRPPSPGSSDDDRDRRRLGDLGAAHVERRSATPPRHRAAGSRCAARPRAPPRDRPAPRPPTRSDRRGDLAMARITMRSASGGSPSSGTRRPGGTTSSVRCLDSTRDRRRRLERRQAAQHAIERRAQAVDVGARIERLGAHLLGRHVVRRADHRAAERDRRRLLALAQLRQAEIQHLGVLGSVAARDGHEVLGLEVAVNDPGLVRLGERGADLDEQLGRARERQRPLAREHGAQVLALDVLHDQVERLVPLPEVERLHDVRVIELLTACASRRNRRTTSLCLALSAWSTFIAANLPSCRCSTR